MNLKSANIAALNALEHRVPNSFSQSTTNGKTTEKMSEA